MEQILTIDGRQVKFKSTAAFLLRYKAQFGRDALKDIYLLEQAIDSEGNVANIDLLDYETFYNLIWVLAKSADPSLPPPIEWLETFGEFPMDQILPELTDMLFMSMGITVKSKKK